MPKRILKVASVSNLKESSKITSNLTKDEMIFGLFADEITISRVPGRQAAYKSNDHPHLVE